MIIITLIMIIKTSININSQQTENFCVLDTILAHDTLSYVSFTTISQRK